MRFCFTLAACVLVTACSHPIDIIGEGDVVSFDGDRECTYEDYLAGADACLENYVVDAYHETYFAYPRPGWYFQRWENYCTEDVLGHCTFHIPQAWVQAAWGETAPPLVAVFAEHHGVIPESRIIGLGDREWISPALFNGVKWSDIKALCPVDVCSGTLMGFDITGWTWASVDDVNAVFNHYLGGDVMGPGKDQYEQPGADWLEPFWADNWGYTSFTTIDWNAPATLDNTHAQLWGQTRNCEYYPGFNRDKVLMGGVMVDPGFDPNDPNDPDLGILSTATIISYSGLENCEDTRRFGYGAWFFRQVPE